MYVDNEYIEQLADSVLLDASGAFKLNVSLNIVESTAVINVTSEKQICRVLL